MQRTDDLDRCPACGVPTHATDSDDEGTCIACMKAQGREPVLPDDEPAPRAALTGYDLECAREILEAIIETKIGGSPTLSAALRYVDCYSWWPKALHDGEHDDDLAEVWAQAVAGAGQ